MDGDHDKYLDIKFYDPMKSDYIYRLMYIAKLALRIINIITISCMHARAHTASINDLTNQFVMRQY